MKLESQISENVALLILRVQDKVTFSPHGVVERFFSVEHGADSFYSQILSGRQVDNFCEPVDCYDMLFVDLRVFLVFLCQLIAGQEELLICGCEIREAGDTKSSQGFDDASDEGVEVRRGWGDLTNRSHICMWLLKTYAIPAGMYASQVWATPFLRQGKGMDNPLQKWLVTVLKRILMVKDTTPSWCVMRECGLEPLQFNWFRTALRLYNVFQVSYSKQ